MDELTSATQILPAVTDGNLPQQRKALTALVQASRSLVWHPPPGLLGEGAEAQKVPSGLGPHPRDMALTWPLKEWPRTQVKGPQCGGSPSGNQEPRLAQCGKIQSKPLRVSGSPRASCLLLLW